jgi:hypothetical protein
LPCCCSCINGAACCAVYIDPVTADGLFHFATFFLCRTQNHAIIPPAQQNATTTTTIMATTTAIDAVVLVFVELEKDVPVDPYLVDDEADAPLAFNCQPVTVAAAGMYGKEAVIVSPRSVSAYLPSSVIQVESEAVPHP